MAKEYAKKFYNSKAWKDCRKSYITQRYMVDGGKCEICHDRLGFILHHRVMVTAQNINDADITLNHCNLQYVCKECHDRFEGHGLGNISQVQPRALFDANGNPVDIREI